MADDVQGVAPDRLRSFIERVESGEDDKRAAAEAVKEIYAEAKGEGFQVGIMRQIVRLRRMKPHDRAEQEELLELYRTALGM